MEMTYARRMSGVRPSAIRELLRLGADPAILSFGGGYPSADLFPTSALHKVFGAAIANGAETLQYTVSNGIPRLRAQIANRMERERIQCTEENILVLQGAQQGLDLVAKLLINPGDTIITENPTFLGAMIAFNPMEPRFVGIDMDSNGMKIDALEQALEANPGTKFIYTIPDFQNPTGVTLSLERRQKMIELANKFGVFILEDTPYREIRYEGSHVPTLKSLDTEGRVVYLGSFSKTLAPGLRLGWAIATEEIVGQLGLLKLAADTQCSTLNMSAVSLYLDQFDLDQHVASIQEVYRRKKTLMLDTIKKEFPKSVGFTDPEGGLFTWLTFPEGFDAGTFMRDHALPEAKVAYVPGATFFPEVQLFNFARVSYATQSDSKIVEGMTRLGRLLQEHLA